MRTATTTLGSDLSRSSKKRVIIVHYGEDVPSDPGYRPIRYGRLAEFLRANGTDVVRVVPSFSHGRRAQRPVLTQMTEEGLIVVVPTPGYDNSRGLDRLAFLKAFVSGTSRVLPTLNGDAALVGVPPPGLLLACRKALGSGTRIVADVRDLWPETLLPAGPVPLRTFLKASSKLLSAELLLADTVIGLSEAMVASAPTSRRGRAVPIGMADRPLPTGSPSGGPLRACFVGTLARGFDFGSMIEGWTRFVATAPGAQLDIFGSGPQHRYLLDLATGSNSINIKGWLEPDAVTQTLAAYDVGVVPSAVGFGVTIPNKVFEYLSSGLFVIHTLVDGVGNDLEKMGVSRRVGSSWAEDFHWAADNVVRLRNERHGRYEVAVSRYNMNRLNKLIADLLLEVTDHEKKIVPSEGIPTLKGKEYGRAID